MNKLLNFFRSFTTLLIVLVYLAFSSKAFFGFENITNIMRIGSLLAILSLAQALVRISARNGIDLSLGSNMAFSGYIAAMFIIKGNMITGIIIGLALGLFVGLCNGYLISRYNVPPFAATFGISFIFRGIAYLIAQGVIIYDFDPSFRSISLDSILGIPVLVYIMLLMVIIIWFFTSKTNLGRNIYCMGSNREATIRCGISYNKTIIMSYAIAGLIASLVGILYVARLNAAETVFGEEFPLQTVAATILAGIGAGKGNIYKCVIGAYTLTIIVNGMNLLAVSQYWQTAVFGIVLLFGIFLNYLFGKIQIRLTNKLLTVESVH
ncbi:MAG: ABC transporter permease [Christensenellales bacterium]